MTTKQNVMLAAKALIIHDNKVLLLKKRKSTIPELNGWDFPGGRLESNESIEDALKREVAEETGLHVIAYEWLSPAEAQKNLTLWMAEIIKKYNETP